MKNITPEQLRENIVQSIHRRAETEGTTTIAVIDGSTVSIAEAKALIDAGDPKGEQVIEQTVNAFIEHLKSRQRK